MEPHFTRDIESIARIDAVKQILEVICRTTGLGFSAVARVTETRWIACAVRDEISFGLVPGGELTVETTICNEIRQSGDHVVIDHVAASEQFRDHHTPRMYGFQSYISVPIILANGRFFGTLCAIDPRPARLDSPEIIGMMKLFADLIAQYLDTQDRMAASEAALIDAREAAQLREQFIAVLGHDLRNPLAAIDSGAALLARLPVAEPAGSVIKIIKRSAVRMAGLIDDVLDFARGRLGGGLSVHPKLAPELRQSLQQVVSELQTAWPDRTLEHSLQFDRPVTCDAARIAQMLSNLIGNAIAHGDESGPIAIDGRIVGQELELSVTNPGQPISSAVMEKLFQPFSRGAHRQGQQGLGLGLYIAAEIARAHGGTLNAASCDGKTCFTFRMPAGCDGEKLQTNSAGL